jgi:hypothetical protein
MGAVSTRRREQARNREFRSRSPDNTPPAIFQRRSSALEFLQHARVEAGSPLSMNIRVISSQYVVRPAEARGLIIGKTALHHIVFHLCPGLAVQVPVRQ